MSRRLVSAAVMVLVVVALGVASRQERPAPGPAARTQRIASELRCPVCQGLSVADSPSRTGRDIRADIRRRIAAGQGDAEIRRAYVDRFGEWILLRPSARGVGALVWLLPVLAVVVAAGGLALALHRWQRQPALRPSEEDRPLVEAARCARRQETNRE